MKNLLLLLFAVTLFSCNPDQPKGAESKIYTEKQVSDFIAAYPDWKVGDTEVTEKFKHRMINMSNEADFLKGMPFKLKEFRDSLFSGQVTKIAIFKTYVDDTRNEKSLLNNLDLQISGLVSDQQQQELKIGENYFITGTLYKQGKRANVNLIGNDAHKTYQLGNYAFLINNFTSIGKNASVK